MKNTRKKIKLSIFLYILILFLSIKNASSSEKIDLSHVTPSWATVTAGNILCQPVRNSFGFVAIEEGKMICAFNQEGTVLWERGLPARPKPLISVGPSDMLFVISRDGDLNMLNPGGLLLWTAKTGFTVTEEALPGRDGRIYVRGASDIACYGIKGVRRWKITVANQNTSLPITELNEGSLLVFLNKMTKDGKSLAVTISPFGQISEEFAFAGKVVQAAQCTDGTLVAFSDGSAGVCSENKDGPFSRWASDGCDLSLSSPTKIVTNGFSSHTAALLTGNPMELVFIDTRTGSEFSSVQTTYSPNSLVYAGKVGQGLVLSDGKSAACYKLSSDDEDSLSWSLSFDSRKKWTYMFPTDGGFIGLCTRNWVIEGYRVKQVLSAQNYSSFVPKKNRPYTTFYESTDLVSSNITGPALNSSLIEEMYKSFSLGDFYLEESNWVPLLNNEMNAMNLEWMQDAVNGEVDQPYFRTHLDYTESILKLTAACGTAAYQPYYASLMRRVTDPAMLVKIVRNAGQVAYDPQEEMLLCMEIIAKKNSGKNGSEAVLKAVCDATFEICKFMGRPAFFAKGKETLAMLLSPQYNIQIRNYARKTLEKFIEIEF